MMCDYNKIKMNLSWILERFYGIYYDYIYLTSNTSLYRKKCDKFIILFHILQDLVHCYDVE